ncbi:PAS domain S-box protein [candidate division WOR-3 bacterium]|nr:PAS domain S-box protein [candidate division WOR-3 bacterium]
MEEAFLSLSHSPPQGFLISPLTKKTLLGNDIAVYCDNLQDFLSKCGHYKDRVSGTVISCGENLSIEHIGPNLWHLTIPKENINSARLYAETFLKLAAAARKLSEENAYLRLEIERERDNLKNAWKNYNDTIDRLGKKIDDLRKEITFREKTEKDLKHRIEFESLVSEITSKLAAADAAASVPTVTKSLDQILNFTGAQHVFLFECEEKTGSAKTSFARSKYSADKTASSETIYLLREDPVFLSGLDKFESVIIPPLIENSGQYPSSSIASLAQENSYLLLIPSSISGVLSGIMGLLRDVRSGPWSEEDKNFLKFLSDTFFEFLDRNKMERKLISSENRFRQITQMLPEAVIELDGNGFVTYANKKFFELFGYCQQDIENGLSAFDLIVPEERENAKEAFADRMMTRETEAAEYRGMKKNSEIIPALFHGSFVTEGEHSVIIRGIIIDLTEIRRSEDERLKLKKMESVGLLAGGIAHDFNNLLSGLFGNIEIAKMLTPKEEKSYLFLETALQAMENAKNLTNQLLTFSKGGEPIKEIISLGELILETAEFSLSGSNVKLLSEIQKNLWKIEADKGQISQVVSNIVINAQQSMPRGGVISISAGNRESDRGREVIVTIKDEGIGISKENLEKIFDPYFTTKKQGSGLGLTISHSIIRKHSGLIQVESIKGSGTCVIFTLPAAASDADSKKEKDEDRLPRKTLKILVLDDDEFLRDIIEAMLGILGHEATSVGDGREAVKKYKEQFDAGNKFDAVISDLTIPGSIGGKEVAAQILKKNPEARIIVMSGYATDPVMSSYELYGFRSRLPKPFRFEELKKALSQAFNNL